MADDQPHYSERESHLRKMLLDAHEQILYRDQQLLVALNRLPGRSDDAPSLVEHLRNAARRCIPFGSSVLVISKGDDQLLSLDGPQAWHFPRGPSGGYAGHHPTDSSEAIAHLENLHSQGRGADFLLIPQTSFWWLDHYADFQTHLSNRYTIVHKDAHSVIYSLARREAVAGRAETTRKGRPFGVNLAGNFRSEKGTGEAVRSNARSLHAAGIPFVLNNVADDSSSNSKESVNQSYSRENPYSVNLIHLNADCVSDFLDEWGESYLRDHYNIGYWVWELSDFPDKWARHFRHFDEIWVPSQFVLDAISRASPVPVIRIPHSLHEPDGPHNRQRSRFGISPTAFCFLFMFDFHSFMERKHPHAIIDAFNIAFDADHDVQLLLKCSRGSAGELAALREYAGRGNVTIYDELLTRSDLHALMSLCDCYVSLHRSEGFGLTLAEAMNLGKPVMATAYFREC